MGQVAKVVSVAWVLAIETTSFSKEALLGLLRDFRTSARARRKGKKGGGA